MGSVVDERLAIRRILTVNHAGEYGAIRIYRAQLWIARRLYPDIVPFLEETLGHEVEHCAKFREAMPSRGARPCRTMWLWGQGGHVLGFVAGLAGRQGVWICTEAVEATVHRHLDDQLFYLRDRDPDLFAVIEGIQDEELQHLSHASERIATRSFLTRSAAATIAAVTNALIFLSTQGDSVRMARDLAGQR